MSYRLAIVFLLLYGSVAATGQSLIKNVPTHTTGTATTYLHQIAALTANDSVLQQLFKLSGLEQIQADAVASLDKVKSVKLLNKLNNTVKKVKEVKGVYQSTVMNVNYYGTNRRDSFASGNEFMNANAQFNLKAFNIPFSVQSSAVFEQGRLRTDFSYTTVQFNWAQYQETLREKISVNTLKDYFPVDQLTNQLNMGKMDAETLMNDAKFEAYNALINHPKVQALKFKVQHELDSFANHTDSLVKSRAQKQIDSLGNIKQYIQQFEQTYETLWTQRKQIFSSIEALKAKLSDAEREVGNLTNPDVLKKKALQYKHFNLKERLALNTKGLDMGQLGVDEDDFTIKNQLLNGIRYDYEGEKKSLGFIIGNSRLRPLESPIYYNPFHKTLLGRQFVYLKIGTITPDSGRVSFKILNVHKTNDTFFGGAFTPNYNTVVGISYDKKISKNWSVVTDFAYSNVRGDLLSAVERPQKFSDDLAASSSLFWAHKTILKIGLGYFYVGSHFITYGNDFLLNNRNGLKVDAQTVLFKNKLRLNMSLKTGFLNDPSVLGLSQSVAVQMTTDVNWQMNKNGVIQFQYSPNTMTQTYGNANNGRGYDYKTNIYLLSGIFNYQIGQNKQSTFVMLSNLNQQVDYFDSLHFHQTFFTNIKHESAITDKSSFVVSSNLGFGDVFSTVQTGLIQSDVRMQLGKKWRVIAGLQAVKKTTDMTWRGGGVTNISFNFNKMSLRCGVIYRKALADNSSIKDEWIVNTAMTVSF
jgi:hypothetical protein